MSGQAIKANTFYYYFFCSIHLSTHAALECQFDEAGLWICWSVSSRHHELVISSSGSYHGYDVSCFVNIWPVSWWRHCFGSLHQLFFHTDGINLCCHAYGFRELKVYICPLSVQFFLYVANLQLHIVIIRNTVVYPIF